MTDNRYVRELSEPVYEGDKILRVEPRVLQRLGLYTIRIMLPPGSEDYAIESPAAIASTDQLEEDIWNVDFNMYSVDNSGAIDQATSRFTSDGHMFIDNTGPSAIPGLDPVIHMGYFLGDIDKRPLMLHASAEIPDTLQDLDFDPNKLLVTS